MAIDKSLPNKKVEIPGPQEQAEQQIEIQENLPDQGETEITPLDDGGVEINFEPGAFSQEQGESHFNNLAELLPEETLNPLGFVQGGMITSALDEVTSISVNLISEDK